MGPGGNGSVEASVQVADVGDPQLRASGVVPDRRRVLLYLLLLAALVVVTFGRSGSFQFVMWDDDRMLYANPHVHGLTAANLHWMFTDSTYNRLYMPLGWLGYALSVALVGLNAPAQHLVNVGLHLVNVLLLFALLRELLKAARSPVSAGWQDFAAAAGAALWAVHPLRVEAVAWVGARVHLMMAVFLLAGLWMYLRSVQRAADRRQLMWGRPLFWAAVAGYGLSLLTFPAGLLLPAVLVVLDVYILGRAEGEPRRGPAWARLIVEKWPMFLLAMAAIAVSVWGRFHTQTMAHAAGVDTFGVGSRLMQAFYVCAYYVAATLWPTHLSPVYTTLVRFSPDEPLFVFSAAAVVGITVVLFAMRRRWPTAWAAWLCHLLVLLPFLGLTEHPDYTSDRYTYGEGVIYSALVAGWLASGRVALHVRKMAAVAAGVIVVGLAALSFGQVAVWRDTPTLYAYVLQELNGDPYGLDIHLRWARYALQQGDAAAALREADAVLVQAPKVPTAAELRGQALELAARQGSQRGLSLAEVRELYLAAGAAFRRAFVLRPTRPLLEQAAAAYEAGGNPAAAAELRAAETPDGGPPPPR